MYVWDELANAVIATYPKEAFKGVIDPTPTTQACEKCGTPMKVTGYMLATNKRQYTRSWKCPQCQFSIVEQGMVRHLDGN